MKRVVKTLKILGIVLLVITAISIVGALFFNRGEEAILNTKINDIDLSKVNDGTYRGKFEGYRWSTTVEVDVKEKRITNIAFIKGPMVRVKKIEDKLINDVIGKQSLKVDTIAGGTISSKAILKAIENAFNK